MMLSLNIVFILILSQIVIGHVYYTQKVKKLTKGKYCIYNSECSECPFGLSRWCKSNTCFCQDNNNPIHKQIIQSEEFIIRATRDTLCHSRSDIYPLASYYDSTSKSCITQSIIDSSTTQKCENHMILISRVDGNSYCANQVSVFDMICSENIDCNNLFSDDFISWCRGGYCHAVQTINRTGTILKFNHCDNNSLSYCKEKSHNYTPISSERIEKCQKECFNNQGISGIPLTWLSGCFCLSYHEERSQHIKGFTEEDIMRRPMRKEKYYIIPSFSADRVERE